MAFAFGFALSGLAQSPAPAVAQGTDPCPLTDCDFSCSNLGDDWYVSGQGEGVWMIVHAIPVKQPTNSGPTPGAGTPTPTPLAATPQKWVETGSTPNYPKMKVIGYWEDSNSNIITAEVRVNDDGTCYEGGDLDDLIRCHQPVRVGGDGDFLCDNYTGVWDRVPATGQGQTATCFDEIKLGFDFRKEFVDEESVEWCFQKAEVTSLQPGNSNTLKARTSCIAASNLNWDREKTLVGWQCQAKEEQRPSGSVDRLDVTLHWIYQ